MRNLPLGLPYLSHTQGQHSPISLGWHHGFQFNPAAQGCHWEADISHFPLVVSLPGDRALRVGRAIGEQVQPHIFLLGKLRHKEEELSQGPIQGSG